MGKPLIDPWSKDANYGSSALVTKRDAGSTVQYHIEQFDVDNCNLATTGVPEEHLLTLDRDDLCN